MEKIRFLNDSNVYEGSIHVHGNGNIVSIKFKDLIPTQNVLSSGFELLNENNGIVQGNYTAYTTIYRTYEDNNMLVELSCDDSVYIPPVIATPEPYVPTQEELDFQERQNEICKIESQIWDLKNKLTSTDYKIIKEYEYSLVNKESEYDTNKLHDERQTLRNQINSLEKELQTLNNNQE